MTDQLSASIEAINESTADGLIAAKCRALMIGYHERWIAAPWQHISSEEPFHLPIINPDSGVRIRTHTHAGIYDGLIENNRGTFLREAKTTSESIEDPGAPYWRRLDIDSQISGYVLSNWQNGRKLAGVLYDVVRKPTIKPKRITKAEQKKLQETHIYFGAPIPDGHEVMEHESDELYELRLLADIRERPQRYFQRRMVYRTDDAVLEHAHELYDMAKSVHEAYRSGRHYRNSAACMAFNRACEYLPLCSGQDDEDSGNWEQIDQVHGELPEEINGPTVLTNTRMKCFQTCRRKEFLRYGRGLRRVKETDSEALVFGSVWHTGLEAWWNYQAKPAEAVSAPSTLF